MGRPKATLALGASTLIERVVRELAHEFTDIVVIAAPRDVREVELPTLEARVIHDEAAFGGPLGALARGIQTARNEAVFACSCDLPFLRAEAARSLCRMLADYDAVIPLIEGRYQFLHAAYHRRCAQGLHKILEAGKKRLSAILDALRVFIVNENDFRRLDPSGLSCFNVNTLQDYERALKLAGLRP
jgi:molybdenum cofactor guanylyltransferase